MYVERMTESAPYSSSKTGLPGDVEYILMESLGARSHGIDGADN